MFLLAVITIVDKKILYLSLQSPTVEQEGK